MKTIICIIIMAAGMAQAGLLEEYWARSGVATAWTPPYTDYIAWSATFDGTLLRKAGTDAGQVNVVAPSPYARAPWYTSLSTNVDPYIGWYVSAHDTADGLLVTNLSSGNTSAIVSGSGVSGKLGIPNTYTAYMIPAPTSGIWTVSWWMRPNYIAAGDRVFVPESPSLSSAELYQLNTTQMRWAGVATFNYAPTTNTWQMWTITSSRELWVNNTLINSNGTAFSSIPTRVMIGGELGAGLTQTVPGLYDDIYYWDGKRFVQSDIDTLYSHGSPDTRSR